VKGPPELETLLADHSEDVREVFDRLRTLVLAVMPGVTEEVDLPDHLTAYGYVEGVRTTTRMRMRDLLVAIAPHSRHVNLQFADGALLDDPEGLVEGTGKRIRHVKVRTLADAERPALRRLIEAQLEARRPIG
jgi:hypothetical protein